jgi:dsRNA-specific ribonuclease
VTVRLHDGRSCLGDGSSLADARKNAAHKALTLIGLWPPR